MSKVTVERYGNNGTAKIEFKSDEMESLCELFADLLAAEQELANTSVEAKESAREILTEGRMIDLK